jgi:hypothetical protein
MRNCIHCTALGIALVAGTSLAQAQTVLTDQAIVAPPAPVIVPPQPLAMPAPALVVTDAAPPAATAPTQTVETVRTVRSAPIQRTVTRRVVRSRSGDRVTITTTRTVVRERMAAAPAVTPAVQAIAEPTSEEVVSPYTNLYNVAMPAAAAAPPIGDMPPGPPVFAFRYVYEPDRILVIDVNTGIAVQAIPR